MGGHLPGLSPARLVLLRRRRLDSIRAGRHPVVLWAGWTFFERGWASLVGRRLNMFIVIPWERAPPTSTAWSRPSRRGIPAGLPRHGRRRRRHTRRLPSSRSSMLGQVLELRARERTGRCNPRAAETSAEDGAAPARRTATMRRSPGPRGPALGRSGPPRPAGRWRAASTVRCWTARSAVDESMVNRESMPAAKQPGDKVIGGTLQRHRARWSCRCRQGRRGLPCWHASSPWSPRPSVAGRRIQRMADTVADISSAVLVVAVVAFVGWAVWGPAPALAMR